MSRNFIEAAKAAFPAVTTNGRDEKAWAKRIIFREANKCDELTAIQVRFAKEALDLLDKPGGKQ